MAKATKTSISKGETDSWIVGEGDPPSWVDKGWGNGAMYRVPRGDPNAQPYTTVKARIGDRILRNVGKNNYPDTFTVTTAAEDGRVVGEVSDTFRPPQETSASLEDLVKTGAIEGGDLDEEAKQELASRAASGQGASKTAAQAAGVLPSDEEQAAENKKAKK